MILTEKEARKKWCPFARVKDNGCSTNRHAGTHKRKDGKFSILRSNSMCIASECMAWRWEEDNIERIRADGPRDSEIRGYCGLAK